MVISMTDATPHSAVLALETPSASALRLGIARNTVIAAMQDGRIPVYLIHGKVGMERLIKIADADAIWNRGRALSIDAELVAAAS